MRQSANGTPSGTFLARAGDLVRAQWFLWVWATLVGRAIGLLDGITRQLDPEVDALEIVARYTSTS